MIKCHHYNGLHCDCSFLYLTRIPNNNNIETIQRENLSHNKIKNWIVVTRIIITFNGLRRAGRERHQRADQACPATSKCGPQGEATETKKRFEKKTSACWMLVSLILILMYNIKSGKISVLLCFQHLSYQRLKEGIGWFIFTMSEKNSRFK